MPLYEYSCAVHGLFDEVRSFSESSAPCNCPQCGLESPRVISIPRLRSLDLTTVKAMDRNERSAHEPHVCHAGCGHSHGKSIIPVGADGTPKPVAYDGPRSWVIEHAR